MAGILDRISSPFNPVLHPLTRDETANWIRPRLPTDATSRYPLSIFPIPATGTATLKKNCGTEIIFICTTNLTRISAASPP